MIDYRIVNIVRVKQKIVYVRRNYVTKTHLSKLLPAHVFIARKSYDGGEYLEKVRCLLACARYMRMGRANNAKNTTVSVTVDRPR